MKTDTDIIQLHQLSMRYAPEQDRIEFLFSSTKKKQYRVWLTRRFTMLLWQALMKIVDSHPDMGAGFDPHVRDAVLGMQHQESVQNMNVSKSTIPAPGSTKRPPGQEPLLVTGCTSRIGNKGKNISLELLIQDAPNIRFSLTKEILHSLFHLLIQSTTEVEWGLNLQVGDPNVRLPGDKRVVH